MNSLSWRSSLVVHGYVYPSGDSVPVAVGLVDNAAEDKTAAEQFRLTGKSSAVSSREPSAEPGC